MGPDDVKLMVTEMLEKAKSQLNAMTEKIDITEISHFQTIKDNLNVSVVKDKLNSFKPDTSSIPFEAEKHCLVLAELGKPLGNGAPLCKSLRDMLKVAF